MILNILASQNPSFASVMPYPLHNLYKRVTIWKEIALYAVIKLDFQCELLFGWTNQNNKQQNHEAIEL